MMRVDGMEVGRLESFWVSFIVSRSSSSPAMGLLPLIYAHFLLRISVASPATLTNEIGSRIENC